MCAPALLPDITVVETGTQLEERLPGMLEALGSMSG